MMNIIPRALSFAVCHSPCCCPRPPRRKLPMRVLPMAG